MTTLHILSEQETAVLSGGCECVPPTSNPSAAYGEGINFGQAKKLLGFEGANPSQIYCGENYGQSKKTPA